jgi:hypothetical protein
MVLALGRAVLPAPALNGRDYRTPASAGNDLTRQVPSGSAGEQQGADEAGQEQRSMIALSMGGRKSAR